MAKNENTATVPTIEELQEENKALRAQVEALIEENNQLQDSLSTSTPAALRFKHEGLEYEYVAKKAIFKAQEYTAEEINADEQLRAELLELLWEGKTEADFNNSILKIVY